MSTEPYYQDDLVTLYHGDSRDVLPALNLPQPDVLVLDPPYDLWGEVPHIAAATVFAFTDLRSRTYPCAMYGDPRTEVIWFFRDGRWVSHRLPLVSHCTILVFGSTGQMYVGEQQDTTPKYRGNKRPERLARSVTPRSVYTPRPRRALLSVIEAPARPTAAPLGRWSKPEGVLHPLIEWAEGETLLDPYCGGGTSLRVAKNLGMKAVGIDVDEHACEVAANRLAQESLLVVR